MGLVRMHEGSLQFGLKTYLTGAIQTVHRGEAAIVVVLLSHLVHGACVSYFSDNSYFVDTYNKGYDHCRRTLNADI